MATTGNAHIGLPDLEPIPRSEYIERVRYLQEELSRQRLDGLFITSEDNFRYFTGFFSPVWINLTRPRYCIIPTTGEPCIISASSNVTIVERTSWVADVRSWVAPNPEDDGVSLAVDAIKACKPLFGRIAAEIGPESRITMPVGDFLRIQRSIAPIEIVDGMPLIMAQRRVKSDNEVRRIRAICQIASAAFEALPASIQSGDTVFSVCQKFKLDLLRRGAESTPYVIGVADDGGYPCVNLAPDNRRLSKGDVLVIDTGSTVDGYYCDFDRDYSIGEPAEPERSAYARVWRATQAGLEAIMPGRRACDVWHAMASELGGAAKETGVGRMGHGVGLRMCEPPSVSSTDETELVPGMVITLEPGIAYHVERDGSKQKRVCIHEENVLVTESGSELLTRRAPHTIPTVTF